MAYQLIIGNRTYSSWSLRAWLLFGAFGIDVEQRLVPLYSDAFDAFRREFHPARQVPTLLLRDSAGSTLVWDSLAIAELLHERHPDAGIWPAAAPARAAARSLCAEMHSGFTALRATMPMNLRRQYASFRPGAAARADIARVCELWQWARTNWGDGGPYLFGAGFTAADAFFAPVACRFATYAVALEGPARDYAQALLTHPATAAFQAAAQAETWVMAHNEFDER